MLSKVSFICVLDNKFFFIETCLRANPEDVSMVRHDPSHDQCLLVGGALELSWKYAGIGFRNHAVDCGHLGNTRDPDGSHLIADESQNAGKAVEDGRQVPTPHFRRHHDEAKMQNLPDRVAPRNLDHRQGVEGDRAAIATLVDQRDD